MKRIVMALLVIVVLVTVLGCTQTTKQSETWEIKTYVRHGSNDTWSLISDEPLSEERYDMYYTLYNGEEFITTQGEDIWKFKILHNTFNNQ